MRVGLLHLMREHFFIESSVKASEKEKIIIIS